MAAQPARDRMYVYGNTVPQPDYEPQRRRKDTPAKKRRTANSPNPRSGRNRRNARVMNNTYVFLVTVAAVLILFVCVNYVRFQNSISLYSAEIAALQLELADLREANNTKYNTIVDSVNMDEIRELAVEEYGMVYASTDQVIYYNSPSTNYVTQYEQIPEDGVLNQTQDAKE